VQLKDLKDAIRKGGKNKSLSMEKVKLIEDAIGLASGEKKPA
jgi:hypothetical protein